MGQRTRGGRRIGRICPDVQAGQFIRSRKSPIEERYLARALPMECLEEAGSAGMAKLPWPGDLGSIGVRRTDILDRAQAFLPGAGGSRQGSYF
jgi:hypothetical protein